MTDGVLPGCRKEMNGRPAVVTLASLFEPLGIHLTLTSGGPSVETLSEWTRGEVELRAQSETVREKQTRIQHGAPDLPIFSSASCDSFAVYC